MWICDTSSTRATDCRFCFIFMSRSAFICFCIQCITATSNGHINSAVASATILPSFCGREQTTRTKPVHAMFSRNVMRCWTWLRQRRHHEHYFISEKWLWNRLHTFAARPTRKCSLLRADETITLATRQPGCARMLRIVCLFCFSWYSKFCA